MTIKIISYDDLGNGICKINNKVCFVKKALVDEICNIKIIKEKKYFSNAILTNIIKSSSERVKPICKYYDKCGGCNFLHATNKEEIEFKKNKCLNYFNVLPKIYETSNYYYRNKVTLHVKRGNIGFFTENTNDLIRINYCYLLMEKINDVIKLLISIMNKEFTGEIMIRENTNEEILVNINGNYLNCCELSQSDLINTLIYNNDVIKGKGYLIQDILSYRFKISANSFFQVNYEGIEKIYNVLYEYLHKEKLNLVLDLYSGTGLWGILISKMCQKVICVEENRDSILDCKWNKLENQINNLKIINGKVEDYIETFHDVDLVIIDPARRGLDLKTINYLKLIKSPIIIYISCSMISLKRDLKELSDCYNLDNIVLVDMFKRTYHVECVSVLQRKNLEK